MTVAELIERLQAEDPDATVLIDTTDADPDHVLLDITGIDTSSLTVYLEAS